jgi:hypothetical protein
LSLGYIPDYRKLIGDQVSLDPATKKPVNISPLIAETPEEKALFKEGEENYNLKKSESKMALRKQTPNDEESDLIHALWLRQLDYHGNSHSVSDSHCILMITRSQHPRQETRKRTLDVIHRYPVRPDNAAPVSKSA